MTHFPSLNRKTVYAATVFVIFCHYMLWQFNWYLAASLKTSYYMIAVPALVALVFYFRRLRDGVELRLMFAYWLWFFFTRLLHDNLALQYDFQITFDLMLMLPFFSLGFALGEEGRRRFLGWFGGLTGLYYFVIGLMALLGYVQRRAFLNPLTMGMTGLSPDSTRAIIQDVNPCSSAYWFMGCLLLMLFLFFECRQKLWRIPIALNALVAYLTVCVTYTRSVKLSLAVVFALLGLLPIRRLLKTRRRFLRPAVLVLCFLLLFVGFSKLSDYSGRALSYLSYSLYPSEEVSDAADAVDAFTDTHGEASTIMRTVSSEKSWYDKLDEISSLRLTVWTSAFKAIPLKPSVLWKGELIKDLMTISNTFTPHDPPHYHNVLLQVLMTTGIPGFLLILALHVLTVVKLLRLFFSEGRGVTTGERILALAVFAGLIYGCMEIMTFTYCDERGLFYYLMSGMALSVYYDRFADRQVRADPIDAPARTALRLARDKSASESFQG